MLRVTLVVAMAMGGASGVAAAQQNDVPHKSKNKGSGDGSSPPASDSADVHAEGAYGGVTPDGAGNAGVRPRNTPYPLVTWVGFQRREGGGATLFLQVNKDAELAQQVVGDTLEVTLVGARVGARNVVRRIDTRYFDSAVREISMKPVRARRATGQRPAQRAGLLLSISFKDPGAAGSAQAGVAVGTDGYTYITLGFGSGAAATEPAAGPSAAPATP